MSTRSRRVNPLIVGILFCGCVSEPPGPPRLKTTPVTGVVRVDGHPAVGLTVECHPEPGSSEIKYPVIATTDADGKFSIGMYQAGDGLPRGTYRLTFIWESGLIQKDQLKRAYADPKTSTHQVTVVDGQQNDVGAIELSTKGRK